MRLSAWKFFGLTLIALVCLFAVALRYAMSGQLIGMLLQTTAIGGFVGWTICGFFVACAIRPFGVIDAVRCTGWMLIFSSVGLQRMAAYYYAVASPKYAPLVVSCSIAGVIGGLLIVVFASLFLSAPVTPEPKCCTQCGYNLTGNVSGMCPECGERIVAHDGHN